MNPVLTIYVLIALMCMPGTASAARSSKFERSCAYYQAMVARGANVNERLYVIDRILRKYKAPAREVALSAYKVERNFLADWKAYLRQSSSLSYNERRAALDAITRTYKDTGVNLALVAEEYAKQMPDLQPQAEPAAIVVIDTQPVHQEVTISSAPAIIEAPAPAPKEPESRTAKYIGFSATGLGGYGLYGGQILANITNRFSLSAGYGMNTLLKTPNPLSSASQTTTIGLLRYGENIYIATGLVQKTTRGEAVSGTDKISGEISCSGVPLVIGVETGNKRGLFLTVEWAYVSYFGGASKTLRAVDPATGNTAELLLESPENGTWFGIGFGLYLF